MKKVYIHIGIGKTGTSSIQKMMKDNQEKLKLNGVLYPLAHLHPSGAQHILADFKNENMSDKIKDLFEKCKNEYDSINATSMILSAEGFCFCKQKYIDSLKNIFIGWNVKIIFYIRNQVDILKSSYLQAVKANTTEFTTFDEYYKRSRGAFKYTQRIEGWSNAFGKEAIIVKNYDDIKVKNGGGGEGDLLHDFSQTCNIKSFVDLNKSYRENESIISEFITLTRTINSLQIDDKIKKSLIQEIVSLSKTFKVYTNSKNLFIKEGNEEISRFFLEDNLLFTNNYLANNEVNK